MDLPKNYIKAFELKNSNKNIILPKLMGWNNGLPIRRFQQTDITWLFLVRRGILALHTGLGKTIEALGLLSLLKTLNLPFRAICFVPNYQTQVQWYEEAKRFTDLQTTIIDGTKSARVSQYSGWWELMINRYSILLRDLPYLKQLHIDVIFYDEASVARHHDIKTARYMKLLSNYSDRIYLLDATPIQKSLLDIHSLLEILRMNIFGPLPAFERRYIKRESVKFKAGHKWINSSRIIGYKNIVEFKERISPFILRRKLEEIEVDLPEVQVQNVWLDLPPIQRKFYNQARKGAIELYESGERVKYRAHFHHIQMACDTVRAFDVKSDISAKLDWLTNLLLYDLKTEKIVVFATYKVTISHIIQRLTSVGINAVRFTGDESKEDRRATYNLFWNDPSVRVLVGTSTLERSLNLQKSAYMVAFNQIWNPQRMTQLVGRIRRMLSEHSKVHLINLLTTDTLEEKLYKMLAEESALSDYIFDETSELFDKLTDQQLYHLLGGTK